ncbi:MAG: S8 family serine peptidase [Acidiferrobacterales bacterium]
MTSQAGGTDPLRQWYAETFTDRLIVKLRGKTPITQVTRMSPTHLQTLSTAAGATLAHVRSMSMGAQVLKLPYRMRLHEVADIAARLSDDPNIEYAEPDRNLRPLLVPADPDFVDQWHYKDPVADGEPGAANLPGAWDITTGSTGIVIAVIDTGILPGHVDLSNRIVAGYDFVSNAAMANDGNGRDPDPTDAGDWITGAESTDPASVFFDCRITNSTWHGTHVAGIAGAAANNGAGGAGVNWVSKILPARALGKCGGFVSDIVDAMLWAAGFAVTGVPVNANPADVLNLSLGGPGACGATEQSAIDQITAAGKVIVVAAGNDNLNIGAIPATPANCNGVITVAATRRDGGKASYSNFGSPVAIAAPGGDAPVIPDGVLSTHDGGLTVADNDDLFDYLAGTSMATPHVSGTVSLMLSANNGLSPTHILQKLQATARTFPSNAGVDCTVSTCGAGIVDAAGAVQSASNATPPTADPGPDQSADPGALVNLDAGGSSANAPATIIEYEWNQKSGPTVALSDTRSTALSFTAPAAAEGTVLTFELKVTDDGGLQGNASVKVTLNNVAPVILASLIQLASVGGQLTFTVRAADGNGTTPILSATGLPAGATFDPATGVFSWSTAGPTGAFNVTFTATDAENPAIKTDRIVTIQVVSGVSVSSSGSSNSDSCFIATAAFGTPMAEEVRYLRALRDQYLLPNRWGRAFVEWYYRVSPPIAEQIRSRKWLRAFVRTALTPLVALSKRLVAAPVPTTSALQAL